MFKINHYIGGVLLVSGTTIGAGMLAMPTVTASLGFIPSVCVLLLCWFVMFLTARFFLDVNLAVRGEPNLISMAGKMIGTWGKVVAWVFYLLLLYALVAAYIAGSAPLMQKAVFKVTGWHINERVTYFVLPLLFTGFVSFGTEGVDLLNRIFMCGLVLAYFLVTFALPSHVDASHLLHTDLNSFLLVIPVIITAFGYHIIIPSLTTYMKHDYKHLKRTLLIGSLVPLLLYIFWEFIILGVVPLAELTCACYEGHSAIDPLVKVSNSSYIGICAYFLLFFAIITSFLGVSLGLSDFLKDGLKLKKKKNVQAMLLTYIPPLIFLFSYQRGFITALEYAGVFVAILLIFLPAVMAWRLKNPKFYHSLLGRSLLVCIMLVALFIAIASLLDKWGVL